MPTKSYYSYLLIRKEKDAIIRFTLDPLIHKDSNQQCFFYFSSEDSSI